MNHSILTIAFQRGRQGTFIASVKELPGILVRGASLEEVRIKITEAIALQQKGKMADECIQ